MNKIAIGENIEIEVLNSKGKFKKSWGKTKQATNLSDGLLEQGTIIAEGDKDATNRVRTTNLIKVIPNTKIVVNASVDGNISLEYYVYYYDISNNYVTNILGWKSVGTEIIIPNDNNIKFCRVIIRKNDNSTIIPTDISNFNVGNTPSSNYPSRIRNIGDNVNLANLGNETFTRLGFENITNGSEWKISGTSTESNYLRTDFISLGKFEKGTYTLKIISPDITTTSIAFILRNVVNNTTISSTSVQNKTINFTLEEETELGVNIWNNGVGNIINGTIYIKLEQGSTVTPYTEYGCGSVDFKVENRNKLANTAISQTQAGVTFTINEDKSIIANGTATGNINFYINESFPLLAGDYILSGCPDRGSSTTYRLIAPNVINLGGDTSFSLSEDKSNFNAYINIKSGVTVNNLVFKPMLRKANIEDDTYVPHQEQIVSFPFTEGQVLHEGDYLASDGIHQNRRTYVFTGTEEIELWGNGTDSAYRMVYKGLISEIKKSGLILSNYYSMKLPTQLYEFVEGIAIDTNGYIIIHNEKYSTVANFKEYLATQYANGTPVIVEYELAEEIITPLTAEQLLAYDQMDGVVLYNGKNYITTINELKPKIEFLYEIRNIKDEQIYVLNKNEELIAVFNRDDEDTIFNPRIKDTQNAESVFTFSISPNNPKWKEIKDPENLYLVDNKIYSTNFEGCFQETISDNNEDYILVTAYERQKLLTRKYVRAWNSETGFETIDTFMVVVLSNGNLPLKNNNVLVNSSHLPGTSGYALDALLYGTGWKTGICDVEGTFDLETDQVDIYENILKIQQIWGGILVFDSVNKIVHHRDETKYLPYNGYEVRYRKNMQSLEKLYNNKIVTRLCPLGEGGLNIKSVNNGSEWLTNFSYTDSVLEGIENNPDILDSTQLKAWGERKLKDLCKPRKELTVQAILLYQVEGYELETIELNDIVDVINFANIDGDIEQLRVVSFDYGIWDFSDAVLELSDITLESTDIFKKTVSASNSINSGTLNSNKVVNFFKNGQSISTTLKNMDTTIEETTSKLTKSDEEINGKITKITTDMDSISGEIENQIKEINDLKLTIKGLTNQYSISGGNNLIRNSVGFFNNEFWEGTIVKDTDTDVKINNESKCGFKLQSGNAAQSVNQLKNGVYNISFNYKKILTAANVKVYINEESYDLTNTDWTSFEQVVTITNNKFTIKFNTDTNNSCIISDLLFVAGIAKQSWSQNANETSTDTVQIGKGIQVNSTETNTYTRIDSDGNRTYNKSTGKVVNEATDKGSEMEELVARTKAQIVGLLYQKIDGQVFENLL